MGAVERSRPNDRRPNDRGQFGGGLTSRDEASLAFL
jgi:hypothetical protein